MKKVIISARGFAVAQTTNKAEPAEQCAQQKRPEKKSEKTLECEKSKTQNQQGNFSKSILGMNHPQRFPDFLFCLLIGQKGEALQERRPR